MKKQRNGYSNHQSPNYNNQIISNRQITITKHPFSYWSLGIGIYLVFGIWLLVISPVIANAQEQPIILTLDEAIEIALRDNRDILLNQEKLLQARLKIQEAKSGYLPEVNLGSTAARTRGLYRKDITQYSTSAGMRQYLYKGGETVNTLRQAKYKADAQDEVLAKTIDEIMLDVRKAFYTLSIAKEFVQMNVKILENSTQHLESTLLRYEQGEASESEILKVKSSLSEAKSLYESSLNQQDSACALLKNLLYIEEKTNLDIKGDFEYAPRQTAIDEAILKALSLRPEIRQYEAQAQADRAAIEIAKAGNRPSIYGSFDYYSRSTTQLTFSPSKGWQDYNVIGATLSWPIFDGWATKYKVEQAVSDFKQTQILQNKLKVDIATQVKEAYLALKTALAKLNPAKRDIELYENNVKVIQARYKDGISSDLDLEDAHLAFLISQFNHKQYIYDCLVAKAKLDKSMGV